MGIWQMINWHQTFKPRHWVIKQICCSMFNLSAQLLVSSQKMRYWIWMKLIWVVERGWIFHIEQIFAEIISESVAGAKYDTPKRKVDLLKMSTSSIILARCIAKNKPMHFFTNNRSIGEWWTARDTLWQ